LHVIEQVSAIKDQSPSTTRDHQCWSAVIDISMVLPAGPRLPELSSSAVVHVGGFYTNMHVGRDCLDFNLARAS